MNPEMGVADSSINSPSGLDGEESARNVGNLDLIPGSGRSPEGKGYLLQYSFLENFKDRGDWWAESVMSQGVGHD